MSLINRMLQDLEARRAGEQGRELPRDVRPLPAVRSNAWLQPVLAVGVLAVIAGVAAILWQQMPMQEPAPAPVPQPIAIPAPAPVPLPRPTADQTAAVTPQPTSGPADSMTAAAQAMAADAAQAPVSSSAIPPVPMALPAPQSASAAAQEVPRAVPDKAESEVVPGGQGLKVADALTMMRGKPEGTADKSAKEEAPAKPVIEKKVRNATPRERAESEYRRALALHGQGRGADAMAGFAAALQAEPGHIGARLELANLLIEQQRLRDAEALLQEGLGIVPGQTQLAMRLARIQAERGELKAAADTLKQAAAGAASNPEFHALYAAVLQRLTFHKDAIAEYRAALRLVPQSGVWWVGLGISLEADGRIAEAREAFQSARASGALTAELDRFADQKLRQLQ